MTAVIRRQRHGIQVEQTTITLPGAEMARLRQEARSHGVTVSRYIIALIRFAWSQQDAIDADPEQVAV
jgi:LDH2 family malate/lactate/ureidoglycolate dehydrogenase